MEISPTGSAARRGDAAWVPADACTLPAAERPLRAGEFDELFTDHLRDIERAGPQCARLVLRGDPSLPGRVQRLVEAEASCCSFFTFHLVPLEGDARSAGEAAMALDIEVPPGRVQVLDALLTRAHAARQGTA